MSPDKYFRSTRFVPWQIVRMAGGRLVRSSKTRPEIYTAPRNQAGLTVMASYSRSPHSFLDHESQPALRRAFPFRELLNYFHSSFIFLLTSQFRKRMVELVSITGSLT